MCVLKVIGMILLAVYLILTGVAGLYEVTPGPMMRHLLDLLGVGAGVLILVTIAKHCTHHEE